VVEEKQEKALAEHVTRHPEDVGRTVEEFNWIMRVIVRSWQDNQQLELVAGTALERDGPTAEPINPGHELGHSRAWLRAPVGTHKWQQLRLPRPPHWAASSRGLTFALRFRVRSC
jgi:hypothetical protein